LYSCTAPFCCSTTGATAAPNIQQQQQQQQQQGPPPGFRNPFLPYEEELWVQHLSDSHTLLLNKFNVVPHHVLVVTRQFESQQDPLNARDLAATQHVGCTYTVASLHNGT
jgi:ATP adenylyltransferase